MRVILQCFQLLFQEILSRGADGPQGSRITHQLDTSEVWSSKLLSEQRQNLSELEKKKFGKWVWVDGGDKVYGAR